jgi:hypothetical protein
MKQTQGINDQRGMSLELMMLKIHANANTKGFWEPDGSPKGYNVAEKLALIHSEVSEALEADRKKDYRSIATFVARWDEVRNSMDPALSKDEVEDIYARLYKDYVKDSFGGEMAGTIIRCLDLCGKLGIDIEGHIIAEMNYNSTRPFKHGKAY